MESGISRLIFAWCGILLCVVAGNWFGWIGVGAALIMICTTNLLIARRRQNLRQRAQFASVLEAEKIEKQDLVL